MTWVRQAALVALSLIGVGSLTYFLLFKEDEDSYSIRNGHVVRTINVPADSIGAIVGRKGANIRDIQDKTGCRIDIPHERGQSHISLTLKGTEEAVEQAETMIHELISMQPLIETVDMKVPSEACTRIIGRNGETIRKISANSNARITVSSATSDWDRLITIRGTLDQIRIAKVLIDAKIAEDEDLRRKVEWIRAPRGSPKFLKANREQPKETRRHEVLAPTGSDGFIEVFVSAIESPNKFWLQVKGQCTVDLDRLNAEMTDYYRRPEIRIIHTLHNVEVGQLVAAPFTYDDKYYRAEVVSVQVNSTKSQEQVIQENSELTLYYVDYGDMGCCRAAEAFELRTDFLKLRFQAIESILAGVKPKNENGEWSEEATCLLENLTHVALWKPLTARIDGYRNRPTRGNREGSPVPCVQLFDHDVDKDIVIADVLVEQGFAVKDRDDSKESSPVSTTKSGFGDDDNNTNN